MTEIGNYRMYFGAAAGSSVKALRKMEEPHVMMSATTRNVQRFDTAETLFLDSGGYTLMIDEDGEHMDVSEYLDTVKRTNTDLFALQDYPCEPDVLEQQGRNIRTHQRMSTVAAAQVYQRWRERGLSAQPVAVVQGWEPEDYIEHLNELDDEGLLTSTLGIGSVCRRGQTEEIRRVIQTVASATSGLDLHAFGVKKEVLGDTRTRALIDSADTTAWYFGKAGEANELDATWQRYCEEYLEYRRSLARDAGVLRPVAEEPEAGGQQLQDF